MKTLGFYYPLPYFTGRIHYIKASVFLSAHFVKASSKLTRELIHLEFILEACC